MPQVKIINAIEFDWQIPSKSIISILIYVIVRKSVFSNYDYKFITGHFKTNNYNVYGYWLLSEQHELKLQVKSKFTCFFVRKELHIIWNA